MNAGPAAAIEIRAEEVRKSFGGRVVLGGISVQVRRGEIVAIVGGSGSGKTVFLDILTGLLRMDSGRVLVADHGVPGAPLVDLATLDWEDLDRVRLHWAVVFQKNALFSGSVFENLALWFREHTEMTEAQITERVRQSLAAAALDVDDVINKARDELSGGMAKRVAIARAIAVRPATMFYDEPTTGLDPVVSAKVHELIYQFHHETLADGYPRTTIMVTHDRELLRRIRPRVVMLHEGGLCYDGPYEQFGRPDCPPAHDYLRTMPVLHGRPVQ